MDENLLAAVVALRFFEELDNPFTSPPTETALQGLHVVLQAQASSALSPNPTPPSPFPSSTSTSIRRAAFWVGFRQEFNLAFAQQRTTRLPLELSAGYLQFADAPDYIWTNRLVVLGARILEYCYSQNQGVGVAEYEELARLRNEWASKRPRSFMPVYVEAPGPRSNPDSDSIFPKIWYMDDCHIVAGQTLSLLDILLTAYSPHRSRAGLGLGLGQAQHQKRNADIADSKIRSIVLDICGMALSNQQSRPAGLTACIAINLCADRFTDLKEQRALMGLIVSTTQDSNYWPTSELERRLKGVWGRST